MRTTRGSARSSCAAAWCTDDEVAAAMRARFADTRNVAEGAGAASLAGALQHRERRTGKTVGVTISGGNVDSDVFALVLGAGSAGGREMEAR
jgi:threonine dehydratase